MNKNEKNIFDGWVGMIRTHQLIMTAVEKSLKEAEMPPLDWYDVLLEVNRETNKRLRLQDIGARVLLTKNNTTRLVDRLEKEELVVRKKCKADGRGVYAYITPKGEDLLKDMWPIYRNAVWKHFGQQLSEHEIQTLSSLGKRLSTSYET